MLAATTPTAPPSRPEPEPDATARRLALEVDASADSDREYDHLSTLTSGIACATARTEATVAYVYALIYWDRLAAKIGVPPPRTDRPRIMFVLVGLAAAYYDDNFVDAGEYRKKSPYSSAWYHGALWDLFSALEFRLSATLDEFAAAAARLGLCAAEQETEEADAARHLALEIGAGSDCSSAIDLSSFYPVGNVASDAYVRALVYWERLVPKWFSPPLDHRSRVAFVLVGVAAARFAPNFAGEREAEYARRTPYTPEWYRDASETVVDALERRLDVSESEFADAARRLRPWGRLRDSESDASRDNGASPVRTS